MRASTAERHEQSEPSNDVAANGADDPLHGRGYSSEQSESATYARS
jgi:hypothetical protein